MSVFRTEPKLVDHAEIDTCVQRLLALVQPDRVLLIGSYAYGDPTAESDIDLLVIMSYDGERFDAEQQLAASLASSFPIQILLRTPQEIAARLAAGDMVMRLWLTQGRVLYEAGNP
ncbi:MAG: nucleotidyltransferase domain-containing protein [bacterium]